MIGNRTRTVVIWVVTSAWAVNFGAGFFVHGYKPSESVNGIFLLVVGTLFAAGARKGNDDGGQGGGQGGGKT